MKIRTLSIGKTNMSFVREAIDLYNHRIGRYVKYEWEELPDVRNSNKLSNDKLKMEEGKSILKRLKPGERLILLDEGGMQMTSVKFANWIETGMSLNGRDICFVIGGAYGFSSEVYEKAEMKISLSKMTFSHQIIRAIFSEQLYRAFSIIRNEPYHHT
ncbi:MAG TPA: 23S rRNA (pseudouridine(1915)-N(3))-methyltransferase RlmH [Flavobacteriales bacterium]|nr:23S rRNA (pseudouridine(1915)-N(3))-methyltransferase RlmH [Flavobacteriales bacterium]